MVDRWHYICYNEYVSKARLALKGVIRLIQDYINELKQEVDYLKNASIELKALNEELTLAELFGYTISDEELINLVERSDK